MPEPNSGLLASAKQLLFTLTSIVSTRLELLANELQEERLRLTQMFFFSLVAVFCFGVATLLLITFIVVLFWDDHRLIALFSLSVFFFALAVITTFVLRGLAHAKPKLFSDSLAELAKDKAQLDSRHDQPDPI